MTSLQLLLIALFCLALSQVSAGLGKYAIPSSPLPATTSPSLPFILPTKPNPAPGAQAPTRESYASTTNLPYDHFSGISLRQLDIARNAIARIFQQAALSASVETRRGAEVFGRVVGYL